MSDYVYELMKQHHSVRKFKNQPLGSETVEKLVEADRVLLHPVIFKLILLLVLKIQALKRV